MTEALAHFADEVRQRLSALSEGEPEDQLRGPIERLFAAVAETEHRRITTVGESRIKRLGRPDYGDRGDPRHAREASRPVCLQAGE